jgi:hypothetical protein
MRLIDKDSTTPIWSSKRLNRMRSKGWNVSVPQQKRRLIRRPGQEYENDEARVSRGFTRIHEPLAHYPWKSTAE